jgi:hypothetical protein
MEDERKPWLKLPDENSLWYERFKAWLLQDKPRSVLSLYNEDRARRGALEAETLPRTWNEAKERYHWKERAAAWDKAEDERKDRAWAALREAERQEEMKIAGELRDKARELLELPVTVQKVEQDHEGEPTDFLLIPEHRAFKTAADIMGQAKDHARSALEMPSVTRNEHSGPGGKPIPIEMEDHREQLARKVEAALETTASNTNPQPDEAGST